MITNFHWLSQIPIDITSLPVPINILIDSVDKPWFQDKNLLAALLTCSAAIGGSLYMGAKTLQATRESNKAQEALAMLKFQQDLEFKKLDIREKLASSLNRASNSALLFEINFEEYLRIGPIVSRFSAPEQFQACLSSRKKCVDSLTQLKSDYEELRDVINAYSLYVSTNEILSEHIMTVYSNYMSVAEEISSGSNDAYTHGNKQPHDRELYRLIQEVLKKVRDNKIEIVIQINKKVQAPPVTPQV